MSCGNAPLTRSVVQQSSLVATRCSRLSPSTRPFALRNVATTIVGITRWRCSRRNPCSADGPVGTGGCWCQRHGSSESARAGDPSTHHSIRSQSWILRTEASLPCDEVRFHTAGRSTRSCSARRGAET